MTARIETASPTAGIATARARFAATNQACQTFFGAHADAVAAACLAMARRFKSGGRLLAYGEGPRRSDVSHVTVEFMHPVVVGKRALPAIGIGDPNALAALGLRGDIFMLLGDTAFSASALAMVAHAERLGMLTLALSGNRPTPAAHGRRFDFAVPSTDVCIIQETHEILYHVLWELVHVFLDHGAGA